MDNHHCADRHTILSLQIGGDDMVMDDSVVISGHFPY